MPERDVWEGCYRDSWGKSLQPESYSHPAKVSRGLARRIYQHMRDEGWLKAGETILDPFAGIAGFALDAMSMGCHYIGIELERPFVDMGAGCECTGIGKADWVRFYGRLDRMRYSGERYICPRCLSEAKGILSEATGQVPLFEHSKQSASYRRNSGAIPETKAHHYVGNLEAWAKLGLPGSAVILQGDSRKLLCWNFAGGQVEAVCGSPPYSEGLGHGGGSAPIGHDTRGTAQAMRDGYGSSPANLGNMKEGAFECQDTFWSASRQILEQVYLCIKLGGHAVFVCGDFIRQGKRVEFSRQWATLCEAVGFKLLHWHRAWKTETYGTQLNTDGGEEVDEVSRISFFRRVQARKGGETISSEEVLCFLRP